LFTTLLSAAPAAGALPDAKDILDTCFEREMKLREGRFVFDVRVADPDGEPVYDERLVFECRPYTQARLGKAAAPDPPLVVSNGRFSTVAWDRFPWGFLMPALRQPEEDAFDELIFYRFLFPVGSNAGALPQRPRDRDRMSPEEWLYRFNSARLEGEPRADGRVTLVVGDSGFVDGLLAAFDVPVPDTADFASAYIVDPALGLPREERFILNGEDVGRVAAWDGAVEVGGVLLPERMQFFYDSANTVEITLDAEASSVGPIDPARFSIGFTTKLGIIGRRLTQLNAHDVITFVLYDIVTPALTPPGAYILLAVLIALAVALRRRARTRRGAVPGSGSSEAQ
jgi:hypothetical protein